MATTAAFSVAQNATQLSGSVASPVLSFVVDSLGALRPLMGIPGSASVGMALNLNLEISQAAVPPGHEYILAETNSGVLLLKAQGDSVTQQTINGLGNPASSRLASCYALGIKSSENRKLSTCSQSPSSPTVTPTIDRIVLSSIGSAAALYSESEARIYSVGNLYQSPVVVATFDLSAFGKPTAFAITDDGQTLAMGVAAGGPGSLLLVNSGRPARLIGTMNHPSAIRFLSNSTNAIVADDADNKIYMLSNSQLFAIASGDDGISTPVAIALSNDNQRVFVGNSQPSSVTTLQLSGSSAGSTVCHCTLTGLYPTNTDSVFRLTDYSGGPVLLFDGSGAKPRIVFAAGSQF